MAYKISDSCIGCGACMGECPVDAIEEGTPFVIEAASCIDCGACAAVCPVSAIEAP
ncbi:ferredoxin [Candidatus Fermentibacteria bacterium]|nr:MAG: ferredoxin [Candidatus Fermentibacteria bacterium]PIE52316.1 MAG: ferredoxin [Candidatus Fermentibacteria bacterium]